MTDLASAFDKLGVEELIRSSETDIENFLAGRIVRIIFYSSAMEGNRIDEPDAAALLENNLVREDSGAFDDSLELINHRELFKRMIELSRKTITVDDVLLLQKSLFSSMLGTYTGIRRHRVTIGNHIAPACDVAMELSKLLALINTKPDSATDAFCAAMDFHLRFVHLHPFEDGNGRIARLLMNLYLLKGGVKPVMVTADEKSLYNDAIAVFHNSGYETAFTYFMLLNTLEKSERERVMKHVENSSANDPDLLELKILGYVFSGNAVGEVAKKEIEAFYDNPATTTGRKVAALWTAGILKLDIHAIPEAFSETEEAVRATAIWAAANADMKKYGKAIRDKAIDDGSFVVKATSVTLLAKQNMLDTGVIWATAKEGDETMLIRLARSLASLDYNVGANDLIDSLKKDKSADVRMRAYQAFLAQNPDDNHLSEAIEAIPREDPVVAYGIFKIIEKDRRLDSLQASQKLLDIENKNKEVLHLLLAKFARSETLPEGASDYFETLLSSRILTAEEEPYALYTLGRIKGSDYLSSRFGAHLSKDNSTAKNLAIFLSHVHSKEPKSPAYFFSIDDAALETVEAVELNKLMSKCSFTSDFLFLFRNRFRRWQ